MCKIIEIGERLRNNSGNNTIDDVTKIMNKQNLTRARELVDYVKKNLLAELIELLNQESLESRNIKLKLVPISEIANNMLPDFITINLEIRGKLTKVSFVCQSERSCFIMMSEGKYIETYRIDVKNRNQETVLCDFTSK